MVALYSIRAVASEPSTEVFFPSQTTPHPCPKEDKSITALHW